MYIRKYQDSDWAQVKDLTVNPEQTKFVGTIEELFQNKPAYWNYQVIEIDQQIVGFFNIDTNYSNQYKFAKENEIGFRAFFIDKAHQGKGYCSRSIKLLKSYLRSNYSEYTSICLTVNCKNKGAYHCYLKGGFEDTQELYHGGSAGPQHIMRMKI